MRGPLVMGAHPRRRSGAKSARSSTASPRRSASPSSCATIASVTSAIEAATGKPAGSDLRHGKRTALVAELAGDATRRGAPREGPRKRARAGRRRRRRSSATWPRAARRRGSRRGSARCVEEAKASLAALDISNALAGHPCGRGERHRRAGVVMKAPTFACGKVILLGEHAVVYGVPAHGGGHRSRCARHGRAPGPRSLGARRARAFVACGCPVGAFAPRAQGDRRRRRHRPRAGLRGGLEVGARAARGALLRARGGRRRSSARRRSRMLRGARRRRGPCRRSARRRRRHRRAASWAGSGSSTATRPGSTPRSRRAAVASTSRRGQPFQPVRVRVGLSLCVGNTRHPVEHEGDGGERGAPPGAPAGGRAEDLRGHPLARRNARLAIEAGDRFGLGRLDRISTRCCSPGSSCPPRRSRGCAIWRAKSGALGAKLTGAGGGGARRSRWSRMPRPRIACSRPGRERASTASGRHRGAAGARHRAPARPHLDRVGQSGRAPQHRAREVLGKARGPGNYPAVPSLSVTLAGLATTTARALSRRPRRRPLHARRRPLRGTHRGSWSSSRASGRRAASGGSPRWCRPTISPPRAASPRAPRASPPSPSQPPAPRASTGASRG